MLKLVEGSYTILPKFLIITRHLATTASRFKSPQNLPPYHICKIKVRAILSLNYQIYFAIMFSISNVNPKKTFFTQNGY